MEQRKVNLALAVKTALAVNLGAVSMMGAQIASGEEQVMEEVVVTGSRIPRGDLNGPSPVAIYDQFAIARSGSCAQAGR